jgi:hypothetical protein
MGKHANQLAYREWERQQNRKQDDSFECEPPPSDDERASNGDDLYWRRIDAEVRGIGVGEWR